MAILTCEVISIAPITEAVFKVLLRPTQPFSFLAGQYLMIVMGEKDKRPFSIVSTPSQNDLLELHIGASQLNRYAMAVMDRIYHQPEITIDIPCGYAWLRQERHRSLLLIAGGMGYTAMRSILYTALEQDNGREIALYWGARKQQHLYELDQLQQLAQHYPQLKIVAAVEHPEIHWQGRVGTVISAVMQDYDSLAGHDIYIAGRFEMTKIAQERFSHERHADKDHIYSDAFEFYNT